MRAWAGRSGGGETMFELWIDGACSGNPGRGGWAAIIATPDGSIRELSGRVPGPTTNIRMELQAAIMGLLSIPEGATVTVYTDLEMLVQGITHWCPAWELNGWRKSDGGSVANVDLWQILRAVAKTRKVTWVHVRGHAGHVLNERANLLAQEAAGTINKH